DILEGCISPIALSPFCGWVLDRMTAQSAKEVGPSGNAMSDEATTLTNQSPSLEKIPSASQQGSPPAPPAEPAETEGKEDAGPLEMDGEAVPPAQPSKYTVFEGYLRMYEKISNLEVQEQISQRQELYQKVARSLADAANEQLKRYDELRELKRLQELQDLREAMEKSSKEAHGQQEKLKEEHRHRAKVLNLKLREAEQQRQRQEELERLRKEEGQERLRRLYSIQEEVLQLNQQIDPNHRHKDLPKVDFSAYSNRGNQICGLVSGLIRTTSERGFPAQADVANAERALQEMRGLLSTVQQETAAALEEKKKQDEEEERKKQNELLKKEQMKAQVPAPAQQSGGKQQNEASRLQVKTDENIMQWYQQLQDGAAQCAAAFSEFTNHKGNSKIRTLKADLQKAATTPVCQISRKAGSSLKQVFDRINNLLTGKPFESGGRSVSVTQHPQALDFVYYKLAERFVRQGEEEVAANYDAAFPIAVVVSGIWEIHPRFGDLFLFNLHKRCPSSVPFYPARKEGTSVEEYKRMLGYKVGDSQLESEENFLKRMSGLIRLYAAIIQQRWPYGNKQGAHPHGLNYGWRWLAQILNIEPLADLTATLLLNFLEVCGKALMKQYDAQFWKILLLIQDDYIPRIEAITSTGQMGSLVRLKHFLKECLQQKNIPPPKGALPASFWKS
ncbi:Nucleoporin GLE1, partial [Buceros rhinoceros silvestris]